jgi:hypothetical protein
MHVRYTAVRTSPCDNPRQSLMECAGVTFPCCVTDLEGNDRLFSRVSFVKKTLTFVLCEGVIAYLPEHSL